MTRATALWLSGASFVSGVALAISYWPYDRGFGLLILAVLLFVSFALALRDDAVSG